MLLFTLIVVAVVALNGLAVCLCACAAGADEQWVRMLEAQRDGAAASEPEHQPEPAFVATVTAAPAAPATSPPRPSYPVAAAKAS